MASTRKKLRLAANVKFDRKTARRLTGTKYYTAQARNMREYEKLEKEKARLSTPHWEHVTNLLATYKELAKVKYSSTGKVLLGLYERNKKAVLEGKRIKSSNLLSIVAKPETLMLAYREIRKNKGALSPAAEISKHEYNNLGSKQKELYLKSFKFPDGMSLYYLNLISQLLRKGMYPWGASRRVYFDKPGQPDKKRPITIPPFPDKIVQKAIELVLQSIYEPVFEKRNRSFGFRPNLGAHDAITAAVSSRLTNGMRTAVEGDIEAAYDCVDKQVLLNILRKSIKDEKFMELIERRLNYNYVEESGKRFTPELGIPQGGIDSPYLFNIYMNEFDDWIHSTLQSEVDRLNKKLVTSKGTISRKFSKAFNSNRAKEKKLLRKVSKIKERLSRLPKAKTNQLVLNLRKNLFGVIKSIRLNEHNKNKLSSSTENKRELRIFYVRYADDWILLTNGGTEIARKFKDMAESFLKEKLKLTLSAKKTLITNITKSPAKFLGFELKISGRGALHRSPVKKGILKKYNLQKKSGLLIWTQPDKQRIINRLYMKGFCSKIGVPKAIPWLSCLEAHAIVERFNASIRGFAEYYLPMVRNNASINRWVYILRYSCIKTLAQKYNTSIKKIFKRFGHRLYSKSAQTVRIRVVQQVKGESFYKDWTLLNYCDLIKVVKYEKMQERLLKDFWDREQGIIGDYPLSKGAVPKVTNET